MKKEVAVGTIRIKVKDLQAYVKTSASWKKSKKQFPEAQEVITLFKAHKNFKVIIDSKSPEFLKGQLSSKGEVQGARINQLPNNKLIDKPFSLFAKELTIHDQDTDDHWDVLFRNKGGTYAYGYTLEKREKNRDLKYQKVWEFEKVYRKLSRTVSLALKNNNDHLALPMYTLLKTHMRIGNEIYYKANGHKGLTTLKKKDLTISGKRVLFEYVGKDGVPCQIEQHFPTPYVNRLRKQLQGLKPNDFVFASKNGRPLRDEQFKKAFKRYCGKEFYPHIIRSHHATRRVKEFLKGKRTISKEEMKSLFLSVASDLGHKRFVKKEKAWKDNYTVTLNHYIEPALVEQVKAKVRA